MIDIELNTATSEIEHLTQIIRDAAEYVLHRERAKGNVCISIVDEEQIKQINNDFRGIDSVTDVLSFPAWDGSAYDLTDGYLGDIAICLKRAEEQALAYGHTLRRETAFLTVHGMLHLLGYDHIKPEDEAVMFPLQEEILKEMEIDR